MDWRKRLAGLLQPRDAPKETMPDGVGIISTSDALVIVGILKDEMEAARDLADLSPAWMAQAQTLERVLPILEKAEIIVIE